MVPVSEVDEFSAWARTKNIGCYFARAMFNAPEEYRIAITHVSGVDGASIALNLDAAVKKQILNPLIEAAVFVFDRNFSVTNYARMLAALAEKPNWYLRETLIEVADTNYVAVGLDTFVGQDSGVDVLSEVVGFAPYGYLPITRRAPVPAIALRTKPVFSDEPLPDRVERRANLAAIRLNIDPNAFSTLWNKSQELRAALDGKDNLMARARVALALPADVWNAHRGHANDQSLNEKSA